MEPTFPSQRSEHAMKIRYSNQEDETGKNYREIIKTLPRTMAWYASSHLYLYEGFWYSSHFLEGIMSAQENFSAQPTDIILSSPMKSGTTWLKALAFAIVTRTRFRNSTNPLLTTVPHDCVPLLEVDLCHGQTRRDSELPLLATHLPYTSLPQSIIASNCRIVYIHRDAKDVFVSLWHMMSRLMFKNKEQLLPLEEAFNMFCEGHSSYGPHFDHVLGYLRASLEAPERVFVLKYEDLMSDTTSCVMKLAEFMGYSFSLEEVMGNEVGKIVNMCSFESLSNSEVNKTGKHRAGSSLEIENNMYFRKGKVGDWRNYLTIEMATEIDRITEHKLGNHALTNLSNNP